MTRLIASSDITFALGYTPINQTAMAGYAQTSALAAVATSGQYSDLIGRPAAYSLPVASASALGGVKQGTGVTIASDGTLSAAGGTGGAAYTLPPASASTLGGVKQGVNITIASDGTISAASSTGSYTLPAATATTLGGVKPGTGLAIASDGTLSTTGGTSTAGVGSFNTRIGAITLSGADVTTALAFTPYNATNPSGYQTAAQVTASISGAAYRLPTASAAALGGIKVGTGLAVATDGTLSATGTTSAPAGGRSRRTVTVAGPVTVLPTDDVLVIKKTTGAATPVTLETSPADATVHTIKDGRGDANTNPITIFPASGTIDGQTSFVMDSPYGAATFMYTGPEWSLI